MRSSLVHPEHTHDFQDCVPFSLRAYSLAEIFGEKLRTIYQRSRGRDYYDLYQIVIEDDTPPAETVAKIFDEKREHAPEVSYHTLPEPHEGIPDAAQNSIADDWKTTLPELVRDVPPLETVKEQLDEYLTETVAPLIEE